MTQLPVDKEKLVQRCKTIEKAFYLFRDQISAFNKTIHYEFLPITASALGLQISEPVLLDTVVHYFRDLSSYKALNGFEPNELANSTKVGAFSMFWLSAKRPIYDTKNTKHAPSINDTFAIFAGLTMAEIDPHAASLALKSRPYIQLRQLLSGKTGSPEAIVPTLELFASLCPHKG